MQRIGEKIKKIRELRNYTQEYVARELEMSLANYSKIDNNHNGYIHNNYTTTDEIMSRLLALEKRISEIEKND